MNICMMQSASSSSVMSEGWENLTLFNGAIVMFH